MKKNDSQPTNVSLRYDQATVTYSTQFIARPSDEELLIELSSGLLQIDEKNVLPIHTRLAIPWSAAERLAKVLNDCVSENCKRKQTASDRNGASSSAPVSGIPVAKLPKMNRTVTAKY